MRRAAPVVAGLIAVAVLAWWLRRPEAPTPETSATRANVAAEPSVDEPVPTAAARTREAPQPDRDDDPPTTVRERVRRALAERWDEGTEALPILPGSAFRDAMVEELIPLVRECQSLAGEAGRFRGAFDLLGDPDVGGFVESVEFLEGNELDDPAFVECVEQSALSITFDAEAAGRNRVRIGLRLGQEDTPTE